MNTIDEIKDKINKNESVQLVGLPGSGKSWLINKLSGFILDGNLIKYTDSQKCIDLIQQKIDVKHPINGLIVFDNFDQLLNNKFEQLFNFLSFLRAQSIYKIKYIFCITGLRPIHSRYKSILGNLYKVVNENIIYMKPISQIDFNTQVIRDFKAKTEIPTNLYSMTGGIRSLIKIMLNNKSESLLNSQLELIFSAVDTTMSSDELKNHGLVDSDGNIISQLLSKYVNNKSKQLTKLESNMYQVLMDNIGKTVTKDQICETVYPEVKNKNGITDDSINQIIHRLRKKINNLKIINLHGLGYKMEYS